MIVARAVDGHLHVIDRMRERVALAEGLDKKRFLTEDAVERALDCLRRFGQRLWAVPKERTRAIGTQTLRAAKNSSEFVQRAELALGHPIEVVSGKEEARLIYSGVCHGMPSVSGRRLVIDVGGGSTECVIGESNEPLCADSLQMGCVSYSQRFFTGGKLTKKRMNEAVMAASAELQGIAGDYKALNWNNVLGSSGTILAVSAILMESGWSDGTITAKGVRRLRRLIRDAGSTGQLAIPGLQAERVPVIAGGVAILQALFNSFEIKVMRVSPWAMREGVLYDIIGRMQHEDIRDRTIHSMVERYHVDLVQAARVERTAFRLLDDVAESWGLDKNLCRQYLGWASRLHEIGLSISYSGYHKHSSYLVAHSDLPGFSRTDQQVLAFLLLNHRRKLRFSELESVPEYLRHNVTHMTVILRIAASLNHARNSFKGYDLKARATGKRMELEFSQGFLQQHPLTRVDLEDEANRLKLIDFQFEFV